MTRVGIIGCGSISKFHYEGYDRAGAKIAHVCDLRKDAADAVASRYKAKASTDYHAVLDDKDVDLVSVCTVASSHKEICLAAIAAGKGVVCEKTLTDNPADSAAVAVAAGKAKTFFATAFMKNFFPAAQKARELLADMGEVTSMYARSWQPFASLWDNPVPAEFRKHPSVIIRNYGGGVLVCGGSHILNLITVFGGRATQLTGQMRSREGLDIDVQANAMLWLPAGGIAHFEAMWHPFKNIGLERNGWDERLEINTPKGRLEFYTVLWNAPMNHGALLVHHDAATGRVTEYRSGPVHAFDVEMAEMLKAFESGKPAFPSAWDGYVVDELIEHITTSAKQNGKLLPVKYADGK